MIIITSTVADHGHLSASFLAPIDITLLLRTVISVAVKIIIIIVIIKIPHVMFEVLWLMLVLF